MHVLELQNDASLFPPEFAFLALLCTELSPVGLSWPSFSRKEMLGFHVEDNSVSLALLGLMVAPLLRLPCDLLHLCHHLQRENNTEMSSPIVNICSKIHRNTCILVTIWRWKMTLKLYILSTSAARHKRNTFTFVTICNEKIILQPLHLQSTSVARHRNTCLFVTICSKKISPKCLHHFQIFSASARRK